MTRPLLLDLFCGAGGAAAGYDRAGFDVVGVDIRPQPRYPFRFLHADALHVLWTGAMAQRGETMLAGIPFMDPTIKISAIHASPPCQDYSKAMKPLSGDFPRLINPVRKSLTAIGLPWVIENVVGAPLPVQDTLDGRCGVELCGTMFALPVWRHRLFETSWPVAAPRGCDHTLMPMNPHRGDRSAGRTPEDSWRVAMGVGWMSRHEGREAVPPAYTEYIGAQLLASLAAAHA